MVEIIKKSIIMLPIVMAITKVFTLHYFNEINNFNNEKMLMMLAMTDHIKNNDDGIKSHILG